ncbi:MAG: site-specific DNA-methyltransferase, partial [Imperialibacter sp.]
MPESYKHSSDKRAHIPSKEEAGYEEANPKVKAGKKVLDLPKNPVVHRGQDPELFWMNKYGADDTNDRLKVDIRSLYRHEHISPEMLIKGLYEIVEEKKNPDQMDLFSTNEIFGNALERDELEKVSDYYTHQDGWTNRLIQGDSLLTMTSLLEREGMAGQVQMIYIDPPYGIKYNSNWQNKLNDRNVKDGADESLSGEPEMIKAFRDTWELGIHSYLSYMRDRLLVAKELLTESGSCFVQISDENVHLVRCLMDEVFGSENFVSLIGFAKTSSFTSNALSSTYDYIIWFAKDGQNLKFRRLWQERVERTEGGTFNMIELRDGSVRRLTSKERDGVDPMPAGQRFRADNIVSPGETSSGSQPIKFDDREFFPSPGSHWKTKISGMYKLIDKGRVVVNGKRLAYKRYENDFPLMPYDNVWPDTIIGTFSEKHYVVQTPFLPIVRCLLMSTDPGDLVLDPTCGSGTTAYVAEQWGRRWITIDTSRIALNIAKTRLMTATFPYYHLYSDVDVKQDVKEGKIKKTITPRTKPEGDIRQGFVYEEVPHITLKSLANDEPPETETLYDKPHEDKKRLRVAGPFTVETLQNFEPISPEALAAETEGYAEAASAQDFEEKVFEHLRTAGVKNGDKKETARFIRVERLVSGFLHAEGFYMGAGGEKKAYLHIGPQFGTVSKQAVSEAVKECRQRGDADWLIILGFSFESDIQNQQQTTS